MLAAMRESAQLRTLSHIILLLFLALPATANLINATSLRNVITVDFGIFIASGKALLSGADPYAIYVNYMGLGLPNLNPPLWLPLFAWLSRQDPVTAYNGWRLANLALYLTMAAVLFGIHRSEVTPVRIVWVLALAGLHTTLHNGQVYIVVLTLIAVAWVALEKQATICCGICIGLAIALKPNLVIWPGLLLMTGYWRLALTSLLVSGMAGMLPILWYGSNVYHEWLITALRATWLADPGNASLLGFAYQARLPGLALPLAAVSLATLTILSRRRKADVTAVSAAAIPASLLLSPIAWPGYTVWLLPVLLSRRWSPPLLIAAGLLVVPNRVVDWWARTLPWPLTMLGSVYMMACLLICAVVTIVATRQPSVHGAVDTSLQASDTVHAGSTNLENP